MCKVLIDCVDGILHILDSEAYSQNATALLKTLINRNLVKLSVTLSDEELSLCLSVSLSCP